MTRKLGISEEQRLQNNAAARRYYARKRGGGVPLRRVTAPMRETSDLDVAYLAGLIDGEGCIEITYRNRTSDAGKAFVLRLTITNTDRGVLQWCRDTTGVGSVSRRRSASGRFRAYFHWTVSLYGAEQVLKRVQPYIKIKQTQLRAAIASREITRTSMTRSLSVNEFWQLLDYREEIGNANGGGGRKRKALRPEDFIETD